jgi:hypothetical protein
LIKYFNGIEHEVPIGDFGEDFTEIIRFKQSRDGKFAIIVGERRGQIKENYKGVVEKGLYKGIFLYQIGFTEVKLIKTFLFAYKNFEDAPEEIQKKLGLDSLKEEQFVEPELKKRTLGEYGSDGLD